MTITRIPFLARVQAMYLPASPLPSTTTSNSSGCGTGVCISFSYFAILHIAGQSFHDLLLVPVYQMLMLEWILTDAPYEISDIRISVLPSPSFRFRHDFVTVRDI
jgi:hypothetical protein